MRRLTIAFSKIEYGETHKSIPFGSIKRLQILQLLRLDNIEFAAICRIEPEAPLSEFSDLIAKARIINDDLSEAQILDREKNGAYIVFIKHSPVLLGLSISQFGGKGGYLSAVEITEDKIKMTYLGTAKQIETLLNKLNRREPRFRILALTDAKFSLDSLLNSLTEKQRGVLIAAYKSGYYSLPRKINSEQLAKKLNLHKSALATHRRKAERRLLDALLGEP